MSVNEDPGSADLAYISKHLTFFLNYYVWADIFYLYGYLSLKLLLPGIEAVPECISYVNIHKSGTPMCQLSLRGRFSVLECCWLDTILYLKNDYSNNIKCRSDVTLLYVCVSVYCSVFVQSAFKQRQVCMRVCVKCGGGQQLSEDGDVALPRKRPRAEVILRITTQPNNCLRKAKKIPH